MASTPGPVLRRLLPAYTRLFRPEVRELDGEEAAAVRAGHERGSRLVGWCCTGTDDERRGLVAALPLVALGHRETPAA